MARVGVSQQAELAALLIKLSRAILGADADRHLVLAYR